MLIIADYTKWATIVNKKPVFCHHSVFNLSIFESRHSNKSKNLIRIDLRQSISSKAGLPWLCYGFTSRPRTPVMRHEPRLLSSVSGTCILWASTVTSQNRLEVSRKILIFIISVECLTSAIFIYFLNIGTDKTLLINSNKFCTMQDPQKLKTSLNSAPH